MTDKEKICLKILIGFIILYFIFLVKTILFPFIIGIIIAFAFNPLANKMEKRIPRFVASLIIITIVTTIVILMLTFFLPILFHQIVALFKQLGIRIAEMDELIYTKIVNTLHYFGISNGSEDMQIYFQQFNQNIIIFFKGIVDRIFFSSIAFIRTLLFLTIAPITAYYFLKDWNKILYKLKQSIPGVETKKVNKLFKEINIALSVYIKSLFSICLMFITFYSIMLSLTGLNFSLFLGIFAGTITIIPFLGALLGGGISLIVAYFQWGFDIQKLAAVLGVFIIGEFIEGNIVAPKFLGDKLQLHPIWVIFALFAGGTLGGFWGIILSLPIAAVIKVIITFLIKEYKKNEQNR
jgi:predicted PurR-regulated permease PerM